MRFRPEQHLRRQSEIRAVREEGRRYDCGAFTLWWKAREGVSAGATAEPARVPARACFIASKAAVGAATRRNRAKRRLREVFRRQQELIPAACDLLLIARRAANNWPMPELERKFAEACRQLAPAPKS